jgi:RNA polymerase sigma-70 factor (ECF subfamily)
MATFPMPDFIVDGKISDEQLVQNIREKDKELFAFIIDRYELKLKSYVRRLTNNSGEVDDLVQQTFVNAFIALQSFEPDRKFSSWIYRIAHNLTINWLSKKKAHIFLSEDASWADQIRSEIDVHAAVAASELSRILTNAINKLPEKFKEPLILRYLEDRSYEEISDILRKPKNTIGTMISRAKILLKKELEEIYGEEYKK